ncbi:MAG TPA: SRPBCC family protein [Allosphingosinicella sp.]|jgi:uncharacterized protein YndB with AHSA1/START domain
MTQSAPAPFGELMEPTTLRIRRLLPGPIERVWAYLTDGDLRAQWLAAGAMEPAVGAPFELVWRNDDLTDPPGERPEGFGAEHRMKSRILEIEPPRRLTFAWEGSGDVTFELEPQGEEVLLTLVHRRLPNRGALLGVSSGWHAHLDLLAARARGEEPAPFWDEVRRLRSEYENRLPA